MRWTVTHGDIRAILLRHGDVMQRELHPWLADRGRRHAEPGTIVRTSPPGLAFRAVLHAVAVDRFYETSPQRVRARVVASLEAAAQLDARRVALTALATGYGRLSLASFAAAAEPVQMMTFSPVEEVLICVRHAAERDALVDARFRQV